MLKTLAASNGKPLLSPMTLKKAETVERSSTILDLFSFQSIFIRTAVITASWYEMCLPCCFHVTSNDFRYEFIP